AIVGVKHGSIERIAEHFAHFDDIIVSSIAAAGHDHAARIWKNVKPSDERGQRRWIVGIIDDHGLVAATDDVESCRTFVRVAMKRLQTGPNCFEMDAKTPRRRGRREGVLDHERNTTVEKWQVFDFDKPGLLTTFGEDNCALLDSHAGSAIL